VFYTRTIEVSEEVYRKLWELARKHNLESPSQLLERLLAGEGVVLLGADKVILSVDCTAQRARMGDKLLNVYYVECRDGARAVVHRETLADLVAKFKLKIKVVE
jgi:phage gp46-like protein